MYIYIHIGIHTYHSYKLPSLESVMENLEYVYTNAHVHMYTNMYIYISHTKTTLPWERPRKEYVYVYVRMRVSVLLYIYTNSFPMNDFISLFLSLSLPLSLSLTLSLSLSLSFALPTCERDLPWDFHQRSSQRTYSFSCSPPPLVWKSNKWGTGAVPMRAAPVWWSILGLLPFCSALELFVTLRLHLLWPAACA